MAVTRPNPTAARPTNLGPARMDRRDDIWVTARSSETTDHDSIVAEQLACRRSRPDRAPDRICARQVICRLAVRCPFVFRFFEGVDGSGARATEADVTGAFAHARRAVAVDLVLTLGSPGAVARLLLACLLFSRARAGPCRYAQLFRLDVELG